MKGFLLKIYSLFAYNTISTKGHFIKAVISHHLNNKYNKQTITHNLINKWIKNWVTHLIVALEKYSNVILEAKHEAWAQEKEPLPGGI